MQGRVFIGVSPCVKIGMGPRAGAGCPPRRTRRSEQSHRPAPARSNFGHYPLYV